MNILILECCPFSEKKSQDAHVRQCFFIKKYLESKGHKVDLPQPDDFKNFIKKYDVIIKSYASFYENYKDMNNEGFISKGTLENVLIGKKLETTNNKVTSVGTGSTDIEYPSAKCVYKIKEDVDNLKSDILETGEVSDSFIHVEDSAMAELQELSVDGEIGRAHV